MAVAGDAYDLVRERRAKKDAEEAGGERSDAQNADRLLEQSLLAGEGWHGLSFGVIVALPGAEAICYRRGRAASSTDIRRTSMTSRLAPSGARPGQRRDGVGPFRAGAGVSRKRRIGPAHFRRIAVP